MSRFGGLRRIAPSAGQLGLLAVLGLVAATLVTATPRLTNEAADRALRAEIAPLPYQARDLNFSRRFQPNVESVDTAAGVARLSQIRADLPAPLAGLVDDGWYGAAVGPQGVLASGDAPPFIGGPPPIFGLRAQTGVTEAARLVTGDWPGAASPTGPGGDRPGGDGPGDGRVQIAMSRLAAETVSLQLGATIDLTGGPGNNSIGALLVGLFEPVDPTAQVWAEMPTALEPIKPLDDGDPYQTMAVTDWAGLDRATAALGLGTYSWRYPINAEGLDTALIEPVTDTVVTARRSTVGRTTLTTSLDSSLTRFDGQLRSARALLAVVQSGLLASLLGLILLAARLAVERRREELALLRARGASIPTIGLRTLAESALVLPAAVLAGWLIGTLPPGRGGGEVALVALLAVVATAAIPVLAMMGQRDAAFVASRRDLTRHRPSVRRLTAELSVLALAGLGIFLLHRRGLSQASGVDPYLVSVPVLLAAGVALIALRVIPWPLRQLDRLAARLRGAVAFLGLARAGRGAPVTAGPLAVLVIAISTGLFSAVVSTTIADTRDRISDRELAADSLLTGYAFAQDTGADIAGVPGVDAVATASLESNEAILSGTGPSAQTVGLAQVLVVDAAAFARVIELTGVRTELPAALRDAARGAGPVPAVVSPEIARALGAAAAGAPGPDGDAVVDVQGALYGFTVSGVAADFPGLRIDTRRFIVLPLQALPTQAEKPIIPNRYLIAGTGFDTATVRAVADAGQRAYQASVLGTDDAAVPMAATLTTWDEHRRGLERTGANEVLALTFTIGAVGATALALLAVGFAVFAGSQSRGRLLSRLRTMGLSRRQGRRLVVYELIPVIGTAVLAGGLVGVALPRLLGPTLGLSSFTSGVATRTHLDPVVVGGVLLLVTVGLAAALTVENLVNRRTRLGETLRLGEESS